MHDANHATRVGRYTHTKFLLRAGSLPDLFFRAEKYKKVKIEILSLNCSIIRPWKYPSLQSEVDGHTTNLFMSIKLLYFTESLPPSPSPPCTDSWWSENLGLPFKGLQNGAASEG